MSVKLTSVSKLNPLAQPFVMYEESGPVNNHSPVTSNSKPHYANRRPSGLVKSPSSRVTVSQKRSDISAKSGMVEKSTEELMIDAMLAMQKAAHTKASEQQLCVTDPALAKQRVKDCKSAKKDLKRELVLIESNERHLLRKIDKLREALKNAQSELVENQHDKADVLFRKQLVDDELLKVMQAKERVDLIAECTKNRDEAGEAEKAAEKAILLAVKAESAQKEKVTPKQAS